VLCCAHVCVFMCVCVCVLTVGVAPCCMQQLFCNAHFVTFLGLIGAQNEDESWEKWTGLRLVTKHLQFTHTHSNTHTHTHTLTHTHTQRQLYSCLGNQFDTRHGRKLIKSNSEKLKAARKLLRKSLSNLMSLKIVHVT